MGFTWNTRDLYETSERCLIDLQGQFVAAAALSYYFGVNIPGFVMVSWGLEERSIHYSITFATQKLLKEES